MKFRNPIEVSDTDKKKLADAAEVIGQAFPKINVTWTPGRKAIDGAKRLIPTVKVSWKKDAETP